MARFTGQYDETFTIDAPIDVVAPHFGNLDQIIANYGPIEKAEKLGADSIHFVLKPRSEKGVTFKGEYTCRYTYPNPHTLEWNTTDNKTMRSTGSAKFSADGPKRTRVVYTQKMEAVMEVNMLLGKLVAPIVSRSIESGVRDYLGRMRNACPRG